MINFVPGNPTTSVFTFLSQISKTWAAANEHESNLWADCLSPRTGTEDNQSVVILQLYIRSPAPPWQVESIWNYFLLISILFMSNSLQCAGESVGGWTKRIGCCQACLVNYWLRECERELIEDTAFKESLIIFIYDSRWSLGWIDALLRRASSDRRRRLAISCLTPMERACRCINEKVSPAQRREGNAHADLPMTTSFM